MSLREIRTDAQGKLIACPNCDNEELVPGKYCTVCGVAFRVSAKRFCGEEIDDDLQVHQGQRKREGTRLPKLR